MSSQVATTLSGGDWLIIGLAGVALLASVHLALTLCGCDGLPALWRGSDGRASTSKFQAVVWTLAVAWALLSLLLAEAILGGGDSALAAGWNAFIGNGDTEFQTDYLALLGIPIGTAVAAKKFTSDHVATGRVVKPAAEPDATRRQQALYLMSNDRGRPALLDFQLVIFNLLLLAFFIGTFLTEPARGLPDLPATLLLLAGISSGGYTLNKALERTDGAAITSVRPSRLVLGPEPVEIDVYGGPFGEAGDKAGVAIEGVPLEVVEWADDHIRAVVPPQRDRDPLIPLGTGSLVVFDTAGIRSSPERVEIARAAEPADPGSDGLLPGDVLRQLEEQLAEMTAAEDQEEELVAATPVARREPGESHVEDERVLAAGDEEV